MKKLIACLFGLMVSISSAMAGTCNLLNTPAYYTNATWDAQTGTVTNTKTDTRFPLSYSIQLVSSAAGNSGPVADGTAMSFSGPITYTKTFTTSSDTHWLRFYTSGQDTNIATLAFPCEPNTTYTFSMDVVSVDPTTVGGVVYTHMQLEKGTTATAYIPYYASCGLCPDGQVLQTYTSATGTGTQSPDPTPDAPVTPTFYTQGNMTLRAVSDVADSYDATTGKITRNIGVKVLNGTEDWILFSGRFVSGTIDSVVKGNTIFVFCSHLPQGTNGVKIGTGNGKLEMWPVNMPDITTAGQWKQWLSEQYANGTPVTVWYQLATAVEEDWTETSYCLSPIKIATTKYNTNAFSSVVTALNNAVDTIKTVVANTITQATAVANLQSGKQQRPDESCPAGKTCLLVEDMNGDPHWYEIVESSIGVLPSGYTRLQYIGFGGTSFIDTGLTSYKNTDVLKTKFRATSVTDTVFITFQNPSSGAQNVGLFRSGSTIYYQYGLVARLASGISVNTDYTCETSNGYMVLGGTRFNGTADSEFTINARLLIGTAFNTTVDSRMFKGRIYYYRYEDKNGNVLFDGIPAQYGNAVGLYDTVSGNFLTSATSTPVTAGPVVLPDGYTALEYIESTGTQYIDTGVTINDQYSYELRYTLDGASQSMGGVAGKVEFRENNSGSLKGFVYGSNGAWSNENYSASDFTTTYKLQENKLYANGTLVNTFTPRTFTSTVNFNLFRRNIEPDSGSAIQYAKGKLAYFKMWDNGSLVRNFVPAKQGNTVGMYDLVSGQFFTNRGTGTFTAGPVAQ